jgi:hypothetical protein
MLPMLTIIGIAVLSVIVLSALWWVLGTPTAMVGRAIALAVIMMILMSTGFLGMIIGLVRR